MRKYNAESPKQGSKRFNSIVKTINIVDLGIIYLWCEHIEPKSKEVSFNMKGIFSCVRYYRKEIFAKGRGPVGLLILKEKY